MKKIIAILLLSICIVYANSITQSNNTIQAIGYGNSEDEALKNAFQSAVGEYVGVLVDSKTISQKGKLLEDKILTFSNGYIDSYKKLSSKEQMGLWEVKIAAIIQEQNVLAEIKKLKIDPIEVKDSEQTYARMASQIKSKFDAEDMMVRYVQETMNDEGIHKYMALRVDSIDLETENATRNFVPVTVKYSIIFKWDEYQKITDRFERLFQVAGAKIVEVGEVHEEIHNRDAGPTNGYITGVLDGVRSTDAWRNTNSYHSDNLNILVVKKEQGGITVKKWKFPKPYAVVYPLSKSTDRDWSDYQDDNDKRQYVFNNHSIYQNITLSLIGNNKNRLNIKAYNNQIRYPQSNIFSTVYGGNYYDGVSTGMNWDKIISPPLLVYRNYNKDETLLLQESCSFNLPVKYINDLKQVTIDWAGEKE